jgi:hypothetical protein
MVVRHPPMRYAQIDPDVNAAGVDQDDRLAGRMGKIEPAFDGDPRLFLSRHRLIVGIRHNLGEQVGAVDEALVEFIVRVHHQNVGFGPIVFADPRKRRLAKLDSGG